MSNHVKDYDKFINEAADSASTFNTPGMGNVSVGGVKGTFQDTDVDTGDQDKTAHHLKMHERAHRGSDWMRPSGDYKNRNWLVPNYEIYMDERQSMARFQIGDEVRCIDPMVETYGQVGRVISFEDRAIRWELRGSKTGIGQGAKQYRCLPQHLEPITTVIAK